MEELSPRQAQIVDLVKAVVDQRGVMPSYREIGAALDIKSTNAVSDHIKALVRKGYLERMGEPGTPRTLRLTTKATGHIEESSVVGVPILGRVAAGLPILASENLEGTINIDASMLPSGGNVFALVVQGESMIEDGIYEGDLLFVRQTQSARDGEIAVVMVDDEATVKRLYREKGRVRLQPANSAMKPIYVNHGQADLHVIGTAVGVFRRL